MSLFYWSFLGFFFGFFFGVGCALAVLYAIYMHGYRAGMADSLATDKPARYRKSLPLVTEQMRRKLLHDRA